MMSKSQSSIDVEKHRDNERETTKPELTASSTLPALTPISLGSEELEPYNEDFKRVFDDANIRNIALSGPYGAGKSSVMKGWCSIHSEYRVMFVSLPHFSNGKDTPSLDAHDGESRRRELEWHLINQLIHKSDLSKVLKTRFRHTRNARRLPTFFGALVLMLSLFIYFFYIQFDGFGLPEELKVPLILFLSFCGAAIVTFLLANIYDRDLVHRVIGKVKFMDIEAEFHDGNKDTLFDVYLDDIVYLLSSIDEDIIVFEDMDRYDTLAPFEELRQINDLVNHERVNRNKKEPLRFFYLVRDGLFKDPYERTKFFDYIIHVIPFIDPTNSQVQFEKDLCTVHIIPSRDLTFSLAHYIDDPRIMHDIVVGSNHYRKVLFADASILEGKDADKLVAMLTYKAFFPGDYELLQRGRGFVHAILSQRDQLIESAITPCTEALNQISDEQRQLELNRQFLEYEVAMAHLWAKRRNRDTISNNVSIVTSSATDPSSFMQQVNSNQRAREEWSSYLRTELSNDDEYQKRAKQVGVYAEQQLKKLKEEKAVIKQKILDCRRMRCSQLIALNGGINLPRDSNGRPISTVDCTSDEAEAIINSRHFPLIVLLLTRGWIDESYPRYLSKFREGNLSLTEREYLKNVRSGIALDKNITLDNPGSFIQNLEPYELGTTYIWSFEIFTALFTFGTQEQRTIFLNTMSGEDAEDFIVDYVLSCSPSQEAIGALLDLQSDPIGAILEKSN